MRLIHVITALGLLCGVVRVCSLEVDDSEEDRLESASFSSSLSSSSEPELVEEHLARTLFHEPICAEGEYMRQESCYQCSICGTDFYARRRCQAYTDAICDWCFAKNPLRNLDFWLKCLMAVKVNGGKSLFDEMKVLQPAESLYQVVAASERTEIRETVIRVPLRLAKPSPWSWKVEFILESMLYLAVVLLAFAGFRLVTRSKPYYRTVTITAPILDEAATSDIHVAAEYLREKLRGRRYEDLEEFV